VRLRRNRGDGLLRGRSQSLATPTAPLPRESFAAAEEGKFVSCNNNNDYYYNYNYYTPPGESVDTAEEERVIQS